jgi:hypothetical protein
MSSNEVLTSIGVRRNALVSPPATVPRQRSKPLLPVRGVCSLIEKSEDQVLGLIEEGKLAWTFDISLLGPERGRSKELRVLPAAVADYMHGRPCELTWASVFSLLVPDSPIVTSLEIYRMLNISGTQLYNLVRAKQIVPCSTWRRGPKGKAKFEVVRFKDFLQARRFP